MKNTETTTKWVLDPTHSELTFKVRHLMITNVKGEFQNFDVAVESDGLDFNNAKVSVNIDADSISTNNADRDTHLKSVDFFDTEKHEKITFESTELNKLDEDNYQLKGMLSIKGTKRELVLDVDFGGFIKDPYGNEKAGFSVSAKFNRKDWGLNWNAALEAGGVMVSDEVRLSAEIQMIKKV